MVAVRATVIGQYHPNYNRLTCSTQSPRVVGMFSTCPFTSRFRARVSKHGGVELCPEQYGPRAVNLRTVRATATSSVIDAHWDMGKLSHNTTFVVVHVKGSWLVDNEYLQGHPSASIDSVRRPSYCP